MDLPVPDIVGLAAGRIKTAIARGHEIQQFNGRSGCRPQCGNAQAGTKYIVQSLLFDTVIFAFAGYFHPECVALEAMTSLRQVLQLA
jgi:hypothetical protein